MQNIWYLTPVNESFESQRDHNWQIENHCLHKSLWKLLDQLIAHKETTPELNSQLSFSINWSQPSCLIVSGVSMESPVCSACDGVLVIHAPLWVSFLSSPCIWNMRVILLLVPIVKKDEQGRERVSGQIRKKRALLTANWPWRAIITLLRTEINRREALLVHPSSRGLS